MDLREVLKAVMNQNSMLKRELADLKKKIDDSTKEKGEGASGFQGGGPQTTNDNSTAKSTKGSAPWNTRERRWSREISSCSGPGVSGGEDECGRRDTRSGRQSTLGRLSSRWTRTSSSTRVVAWGASGWKSWGWMLGSRSKGIWEHRIQDISEGLDLDVEAYQTAPFETEILERARL